MNEKNTQRESQTTTGGDGQRIQLDVEDHIQACEAADDVDAILDVIITYGGGLKNSTLLQLLSMGQRRNHDIRSALHVL